MNDDRTRACNQTGIRHSNGCLTQEQLALKVFRKKLHYLIFNAQNRINSPFSFISKGNNNQISKYNTDGCEILSCTNEKQDPNNKPAVNKVTHSDPHKKIKYSFLSRLLFKQKKLQILVIFIVIIEVLNKVQL